MSDNFLTLPTTQPVVVGGGGGGGFSNSCENAYPIINLPHSSRSSPTTGGSGRHSPVATSPDGKFILQYLGAAMMDSRCTYTPQMMPWIIAEIMRFSEPLQVK